MEYETTMVSIGGKRLRADVADSMRKRAKGLSGRERLGTGRCMLFIFPRSGSYPIWMRGMKFPIDVLWLDEKKRVTDLRSNLKPATSILDFKTYSHNGVAKYAIELPAGFAKRNKVKPGTKAEF